MGKRLPKSELLEEIALERQKLIELLASVSPRQFTRSGINEAGWAIKDVITHLVDWETRINRWCSISDAEETPVLPDENYGWGDVRALNDAIFRKHRRKSRLTVLQEFDEVHQQTLKRIDQLSNDELTTLGYHNWTGTRWTLSDYFRANTASHYRWATKKIRKALKEQNTKSK